MATQTTAEKQFSAEHVEQFNGGQSDNSNSSEKDQHVEHVVGEKGQQVDHVHRAEQGDKFHAMRIDGDGEDHMYASKQELHYVFKCLLRLSVGMSHL